MKDLTVIPVWDKTEQEWLEIRKGGIGGSDAGTVVGVNKYKSPYALWAEKTGAVETEFTGNEATKWGHRLERIVAQAYAEDYDKAVVEWPVILWSKEHPWMYANLDFVVVEPSEEFPKGQVTIWHSTDEPKGVKNILEVKTAGIASYGNASAWANDGIPQSYMLQGYHYGIVTGWTEDFTFAALVAGQGLQVRHMPWDQSVADNLIAAEEMFWDLVTLETPPEADGSNATESVQQARYPRHSEGKEFEGGNALSVLWEEHAQAKVEEEEAINRRKALRARIVEMVGDAEFATVNGKPIFSYKAGREVESVDTERLKREAPEIFAQFRKIRPGARILRGISSK